MRPRVFIDANLWYPPSGRALLLGTALAGTYEFVTSEGVLDELHRHLAVTEKTNLSPAQAAVRVDELVSVLEDCMTGAVAATDANSSFDRLGLPDPDDEHVVAGALAADADLLLTANVDDFPPELLARVGLDVLQPDGLLADGLRALHPEAVEAVGHALRFPPKGVVSPQDLGYALSGCAGFQACGGCLASASWYSPNP